MDDRGTSVEQKCNFSEVGGVDGRGTSVVEEGVDDAVQRLIEIGAISKLRLELTPLGHHLSFVPIELRLAKMYVVACCCSVTRNTSRALAS